MESIQEVRDAYHGLVKEICEAGGSDEDRRGNETGLDKTFWEQFGEASVKLDKFNTDLKHLREQLREVVRLNRSVTLEEYGSWLTLLLSVVAGPLLVVLGVISLDQDQLGRIASLCAGLLPVSVLAGGITLGLSAWDQARKSRPEELSANDGDSLQEQRVRELGKQVGEIRGRMIYRKVWVCASGIALTYLLVVAAIFAGATLKSGCPVQIVCLTGFLCALLLAIVPSVFAALSKGINGSTILGDILDA